MSATPTEPQTVTEPRPTAHTFEQVNWDNAERETRIGVLQEMVAILLNRLDEAEAAQGAAPRTEGLPAIEWPSCTTHHGCRCREYAVEYVNRLAIDGILAAERVGEHPR